MARRPHYLGIAAVSLVLLAAAGRAAAQSPEPLTALATAAAALSAGETATFTAAPEYSNDLHWQSNWFFDETNQRGHLLYKAPGGTTHYRHAIYDATADEWTGPTDFLLNTLGHIWGSTAFDPATGDLYQQTYGSKFARRWTAANQSWDFTTSAFAFSNTATFPYGSLIWHPNLYGTGDGGLILDCGYGSQPILGWRKSTDTWSILVAGPTGTAGRNGVGTYFPSADVAITGGNDNAASVGTLVSAGPSTEAGDTFPLRTCSDSFGTSAYASIMVHPNNSAKLLLLQNGANGAGCYHSTDGVAWTQADDHPLQDSEGGIFCSIPSLGVIWFIGRSSQSVLWKPPA